MSLPKEPDQGGRPFGAVLATAGQIVATDVNNIVQTHDISARAEIEAIRAACRRLRKSDLKGGRRDKCEWSSLPDMSGSNGNG